MKYLFLFKKNKNKFLKLTISKMKSTLAVFVIISLTLLNIVEISKGSNQLSNTSMMDVIQSILNHHEFITLNPREQLHVLVAIYNLLKGHYFKRDVTTSMPSTWKPNAAFKLKSQYNLFI